LTSLLGLWTRRERSFRVEYRGTSLVERTTSEHKESTNSTVIDPKDQQRSQQRAKGIGLLLETTLEEGVYLSALARRIPHCRLRLGGQVVRSRISAYLSACSHHFSLGLVWAHQPGLLTVRRPNKMSERQFVGGRADVSTCLD
jgi:hypothetical protein